MPRNGQIVPDDVPSPEEECLMRHHEMIHGHKVVTKMWEDGKTKSILVDGHVVFISASDFEIGLFKAGLICILDKSLTGLDQFFWHRRE